MEPGYKSIKPGTVFNEETGKLYLFTFKSISVMFAWPKPMAWKKTLRSNPTWIHFRPKISIPRLDIDARIRQLETPGGENLLPVRVDISRPRRAELSRLRWYATIPAEVREIISNFPSRQWHMLSFLARCGSAAHDLMLSNPALSFMLANNWVYHSPPVQRPLRSARALLNKKQRKILGWLGFPETKSARKTLAKITYQSLNIYSLLNVRDAMSDPGMFKAMSHLPRLNTEVIRIATDPELLPFTAPTLLEEIAMCCEEDESSQYAHILADSVNLFHLLSPDGMRLQPIRCIDDLLKFRDSVAKRLHRARKLRMSIPFPPPPVQGNDNIVPITNMKDLMEEALIQNNCVASYIEQIAIRQEVYIYRILWPERCTLALTRYGNTWVPWQLKRAGNQAPSEATCRVVEEWLPGKSDLKLCNAPAMLFDGEDIPF